MKKLILFISIIALLLSGCSQTETYEDINIEPIEPIENEISSELVCRQENIEYEISNVVSEIEPRPNEARREYDMGYLEFSLLNKDKDISGYFNVSIKCDMPEGSTKEYKYVNIDAGNRETIKLMCSKRGTIRSIEGPVIESAPTIEKCETN